MRTSSSQHLLLRPAFLVMAAAFFITGVAPSNASGGSVLRARSASVPVTSSSGSPGRSDGNTASRDSGASTDAGHDHSGHATPSASISPAKAPDSPAVSWFAGGGGLYTPPYYDSFKGLDLSPLTPVQKERFVHWVNTEFCTCHQTGCTSDTIANCYTNDPTCPWAPARIREILAKVKSGSLPPGATAQPSSPQAPVPTPAPQR